jgi:hypothetical protein
MAATPLKKLAYRVTLLQTTEAGTVVPITLARRKRKKSRRTCYLGGCCPKVCKSVCPFCS